MDPRALDRAPDVLAQAGVRLGQTYPRSVVDHAQARLRALEALKTMAARSWGDCAE